MKKLLLLAALTVSYGFIQAVPSLTYLKNQYLEEHKSAKPDELVVQVLGSAIDGYLGYNRRNQMLPLATVKDILAKWYKEDPALFSTQFEFENEKINLADYYLILSKLNKSPAEVFQRYKDIVAILQSFGVRPMLSDKDLDIIAHLLAQ